MKSKRLSETLLSLLKSKKYKFIELDYILRADHIIERSGQNFKKFMISFNDKNGREFCLRPDLTTVSCLRYINRKDSLREKIFYEGEVYRNFRNKKKSIINKQVGWEILGGVNEKNDDKEIIDTSLKCLSKLKFSTGKLIIGNIEIFKLFISHLKIPERWKLRLIRHYWRKNYFNDLLTRLSTNSDVDPQIVKYDKKRFKRMLNENKKNKIAGRSLEEILNRLSQKINDPREVKEGRKVVKLIKEYLSIVCPIETADKKLNTFFKKNNINLRVDRHFFPLNKNKSSKVKVYFSSSFGRELEYYTGMVFKIEINNQNIINGGRYNNLMKDLGSKKRVNAVGAAINFGDLK